MIKNTIMILMMVALLVTVAVAQDESEERPECNEETIATLLADYDELYLLYGEFLADIAVHTQSEVRQFYVDRLYAYLKFMDTLEDYPECMDVTFYQMGLQLAAYNQAIGVYMSGLYDPSVVAVYTDLITKFVAQSEALFMDAVVSYTEVKLELSE